MMKIDLYGQGQNVAHGLGSLGAMSAEPAEVGPELLYVISLIGFHERTRNKRP